MDTVLSQDHSSFASALSVSTSFSSLPSPSFPSASLPQPVPRPSHPSSSQARSFVSSHAEDILSPGDIVGDGILLQGEPLRLGPNHPPDHQQLAAEYQVVRKLGTGSYAVVYLVRQILSRSPPSEDDHIYPSGRLELDDAASTRSPTEYGREYAIKLLSKADLDEEELFAQLTEATIHQSLPAHPNIVTLHRTLETSAFLLLLLEFVPGQDLFYFLEQARDHYEVDPADDPLTNHTPPTPGLLSSLHPAQLLSHTRLRLIASMFSQMCEAVATCHDASVFHRDIKPENFIVTDGWISNQDGIRERKVIVKLSDFGLSTRDAVSSDMDCGSAPYMSYECRNNVAPVYRPRAADVWSLGIVLINMLYHCNPWVDTVKGGCTSFDHYLSNPTSFFMRRFTGMTLPVANFLVENVFCILDEPTDDSQRIGAREFGIWIRDLPTLMAASQPVARTHSRVPSTASVATGHPLASAPASCRPSSRQASVAGGSPRRPSVVLRTIPRNTSMEPVLDHDGPDGTVLASLELVLNEEDEEEEQQPPPPPQAQEEQQEQHEAESGRSPSPSLRSSSNTKRRKRGRKGKGMVPPPDRVQTSELLASASQTLARELSRQIRSASASMQSFPDVPLPPPVPLPVSMPTATVTKKPSRWKLPFGKSSGEATGSTRSDSRSSNANSGSALVNNVSHVIMGLDAPFGSTLPLSSCSPPSTTVRGRGEPQSQSQSQSRRPASPTSIRSGRPVVSNSSSSSNWRNSMASTNTTTSTSTSSSGFTRFSNHSMRSVSTFATSVSASSASSSTNWRKHPDPVFPSSSSLASSNIGSRSNHNNGLPRRPPGNIKLMTGVPWELSGAPRQLHQKEMDIFGVPPQPRERKRAGRGGGKGKQPVTGTASKSALEPINERPQHQAHYRQDAATSTTDLPSQAQQGQGLHGQGQSGQDCSEAPRTGRHTLHKMLSALMR
ncbi:kinase-like protein [Russula earlei]|uniref:Kinase-like protein n=1 Tax=Russula earlei TaxID=71964 RepID=A0ACC0UJH6_9AGAM|nr:kinase-like protein [Russula earlei]